MKEIAKVIWFGVFATCTLLAGASAVSKFVSDDYCQWDLFNATCPPGEIVLMTSAQYGRMKVGRCIPLDYHLGCSVDVLERLEGRCSGRESCVVPVPDTELFRVHPCRKDLVAYLQASYRCAPVNQLVPNAPKSCDSQRPLELRGPSGFLSLGGVSQPPGLLCPWLVRAPPGQRVQLTLHDYSGGENTGAGVVGARRAPGAGVKEAGKCPAVALIQEQDPPPIGVATQPVGVASQPAPPTAPGEYVRLCADAQERSRVVYSSRTSRVTIRAVNGSFTLQPVTGHVLLLEFEVTGCADPVVPSSVSLAHSGGDTLVVTCNRTGERWHLVCRERAWVGAFGNCSRALTGSEESSNANKRFSLGLLVAISIGIVVGVAVGFLLLVTIFTCRKRRAAPYSPAEQRVRLLIDHDQNSYKLSDFKSHLSHSPASLSHYPSHQGSCPHDSLPHRPASGGLYLPHALGGEYADSNPVIQVCLEDGYPVYLWDDLRRNAYNNYAGGSNGRESNNYGTPIISGHSVERYRGVLHTQVWSADSPFNEAQEYGACYGVPLKNREEVGSENGAAANAERITERHCGGGRIFRGENNIYVADCVDDFNGIQGSSKEDAMNENGSFSARNHDNTSFSAKNQNRTPDVALGAAAVNAEKVGHHVESTLGGNRGVYPCDHGYFATSFDADDTYAMEAADNACSILSENFAFKQQKEATSPLTETSGFSSFVPNGPKSCDAKPTTSENFTTTSFENSGYLETKLPDGSAQKNPRIDAARGYISSGTEPLTQSPLDRLLPCEKETLPSEKESLLAIEKETALHEGVFQNGKGALLNGERALANDKGACPNGQGAWREAELCARRLSIIEETASVSLMDDCNRGEELLVVFESPS